MQIAIVGSTKGHGFSARALELAESVGKEIAQRGHTVLYGPEISVESLPYITAASAKRAGGQVIAVAIGRARSSFFDQDIPDYTIYTDGGGGASREVVLINSADAVIAIGGGSGTLTEMSMAYMNHVPIVGMLGSGGWADRLADQYIDDRKKYKVYGAKDAKDAVDAAERLVVNFASVHNEKYI